MHDSPLWRALERLADTVMVGVFTLVAGAAVLTLPAALSAAHATLADTSTGGSLAGRYLAALRPRLRTGTKLAALALTASVVATADLMWATNGPLTALTTLVLAAGALLALATTSVVAVACAGPLGSDGITSVRTVVRRAGLHAAAAPHRPLAVVAIALTGSLLTLSAPVLLPLAPLVLALVAHSLRWARPRPAWTPGAGASSPVSTPSAPSVTARWAS